jgi:hypothetical protein
MRDADVDEARRAAFHLRCEMEIALDGRPAELVRLYFGLPPDASDAEVEQARTRNYLRILAELERALAGHEDESSRPRLVLLRGGA